MLTSNEKQKLLAANATVQDYCTADYSEVSGTDLHRALEDIQLISSRLKPQEPPFIPIVSGDNIIGQILIEGFFGGKKNVKEI